MTGDHQSHRSVTTHCLRQHLHHCLHYIASWFICGILRELLGLSALLLRPLFDII